MYFSKHNKDVTYTNHYSGLLEVKGTGILTAEDARVSPAERGWADDYDTLDVTEGITGIGEGYLDAFPNLICLILSRSVTAVSTTPELDKRFRKKNVLIRGEYETFAETFAKERQLAFLHADIPLAVTHDERHYETDYITLRFFEKGKADIHHNVFSPGSSAGSYGGGEFANPLPRDFYAGCTVKAFASVFSEEAREQILNNDMLRRFLEAANRRLKKS